MMKLKEPQQWLNSVSHYESSISPSLAPSLYVDISLDTVDRVKLDLGVGYYAEVSREYAIKYFER